jgi:hypothetical protein
MNIYSRFLGNVLVQIMVQLMAQKNDRMFNIVVPGKRT